MKRAITNRFTIVVTILVLLLVLNEGLRSFITPKQVLAIALVSSALAGATVSWFLCYLHHSKKLEQQIKGGVQ